MTKLTANSLTKQEYKVLWNIAFRFTKNTVRTDELLHVVLLRLLEKNITFNIGMFYVITKNELIRLQRNKEIPSSDKINLFEETIEFADSTDSFLKLSNKCSFTKAENKAIDLIVHKKTDLQDVKIQTETLKTVVRSIVKKVREQNNIDVSLPIHIRGQR